MINPIKLTREVQESYLRYLMTTFEIADERIREAFRRELYRDEGYINGPFLEATPPFRLGRSLRELIVAGNLSSAWLDVPSVDVDRRLYSHQDRALEKIQDNRNVIVSTGTGSGKTESFLYPIIDSLMREHIEGKLSPGIRALLLYPMNALVNDQLKRLRGLLRDIPYITFGRFTGETRDTDAQAMAEFRFAPPPNEIISRAQLRRTPPHILVTNYAMLEYLLQRPDDTPLFDGQFAGNWRFLVLDEVHTYSGASGAEVGMLIRRLKDQLNQPKLQAIGTSATIGSGEKDYVKVAQFASNLFAESFEWVVGDSRRQDIVGAARLSLEEVSPTWGRLSPQGYEVLYEWALEGKNPERIDFMEIGIATHVSQRFCVEWHTKGSKYAIYNLLVGDENIRDLSRYLEESQPLGHLIEMFSSVQSFTDRDFLSMVNLAVWAKPTDQDQSLIPARYHLFVRATEGVFLALYPEWKVFLQRHESYTLGDETYPVCELGYCRRCGAPYLVGNINESESRLVPYAPYRLQNDVHAQQFPDYFAVTVNDEEVEDDTDGILTPENLETFQFCRRCGWIASSKVKVFGGCKDDGTHELISLIKSPLSQQGYHRCVQCGAGSGRGPSRFVTGQDAAAAVVATAVYSALQPDRPADSIQLEDLGKLLVFSDSRQDAAFFAPYLETSYQRIVWRRLIWEALTREDMVGQDNPWIADVHERLLTLAEEYGMLALLSGLSVNQKSAMVWEVLLRELVSDSDIGLERVGMIAIDPIIDSKWRVPSLAHWSDTEHTWDLISVLWNEFRTVGALSLPKQVSASKVLPYESSQMPGFSRVTRAGGILPWLPEKTGYRNSRLDYVARIGIKLGWPEEAALEWARDLLNEAFTYFTDESQPWAHVNTVFSSGKTGMKVQATHLRWVLRPLAMHEVFRCNTCGRITVHNLLGVCPAWKCAGTLEPADPARLSENHYYQMYRGINPVPMVAREHTAQINSQDAQRLQEDFSQGRVSVLSCSTTFELGVDAGDLEAVFMRNVPPEPANYVQRVGRAGRRTSSAAIAVTFAQRRSHDIAQFNNPKRYVDGRVSPPRIILNNEKIARRHLHAVVTSWYFHHHPESFGSMKEFLSGANEQWEYHLQQLRQELHPVPSELKRSIERVIPPDLHEVMEIETDGWVDKLVGPNGVMTQSIDTLHDTLLQIQQVRNQMFQAGKHIDAFTRILDTLLSQHCLQFFPSHNVLPKYGFPVDLVELRIMDTSPEALRVDLTRDLGLAILEYAPGNTVVAGGLLWKSHGLLRRPGLEWRRHTYSQCRECGYFAISKPFLGLETEVCPGCGSPLSRPLTMVIPQFGFTTSLEDKPSKPGNQRPERVGARRVFFSAFGEHGEPEIRSEHLLDGTFIQWSYSRWGQFTVLNHGQYGRGYHICNTCGWAAPVKEISKRRQNKQNLDHRNSMGTPCPGSYFYTASLGHQFGTDVVLLTFSQLQNANLSFWYSLLYALLEGAIEGLSINRRDLGATLYWTGTKMTPTLVFYDDVPGGAGHVQHITENWMTVFREARMRVAGGCGCGPETSCYGCLRSYENQLFHDLLTRGSVKDFLDGVLGYR
ncbi:hypothetical protein BXT84_10735 [Sulfobacillus thermotolerans]|uniref:DEAD/DEAH box helicase n=1 Tax=Sulfobacillus thermotolerans TaxID=338644 RepID=A0ABN5H168_9FIRM|nr:hypothetical protein BXT84_10735 [Sulfobacillus thermotolerans]